MQTLERLLAVLFSYGGVTLVLWLFAKWWGKGR